MPRQIKKGDVTRAVAREQKLQVIRDRVAANAVAEKAAADLEMAQIADQEKISEAVAVGQRAKRNRAQAQELAKLDTPVKAGVGSDGVINRADGIAAEKERIAIWIAEFEAREEERVAADIVEDKWSNARFLAHAKDWGAHLALSRQSPIRINRMLFRQVEPPTGRRIVIGELRKEE